MSLLSNLFKSSKKVNLTPDEPYKMPSQINPDMYAKLSNLSKDYIEGKGTGFGEDYVNKNTNPVAEASRRNFRNVTSPLISSQYSSRGLGRSSLAANAQGLAEGNVESDISQLMAQFYNLNEQQKKTDTQFGANLGQNILTGDVNAQSNIAGASERLANATAGDARTREALDTAKAGKIVGTLMNLAVPGSGGAFQQPTLPQQTQQTTGTNTASNNPIKTNIAGSSNQDFQAFFKQLLGMA